MASKTSLESPNSSNDIALARAPTQWGQGQWPPYLQKLLDSCVTSGHSTVFTVESNTMSDLLQYGGPVLWLQTVLAFLAIVYIIERLLYFHSGG